MTIKKEQHYQDIRHTNNKKFQKKYVRVLSNIENFRHEKLEIRSKRRKIALISVPILLPFCLYLDDFISDLGFPCVITLFLLGGLGWWCTEPSREYVREYKRKMLPRIASIYGDFRFSASRHLSLKRLEPTGIIPNYTSSDIEDYFSGEYKGVKVEFFELELVKGSGRNMETVFDGRVIIMSMKRKSFFGHTIIDRKRMKFPGVTGSRRLNLDQAKFVDPEFESLFDVYTNDQVEARYLVDPLIMDALIKVVGQRKRSIFRMGKSDFCIAYLENQVVILVRDKTDFFEPAGLNVPAENIDTISVIKQQIVEILSFIDILQTYDPAEAHKAIMDD